MKITIENTDQLPEAAKKFLRSTGRHNIFAFYGSMGAGKTTVIKAICNRLGSIDTVTSPSFTLINEYRTHNGDVLYHFDFFRIKTQEEVFDFGFEEYLASGRKCFIEWPEKIESLLPEETVKVYITVKTDLSRIVEVKD
jgi:tRNA threonylcarbamoyladenosine biosynthesis protein TsaE